MRSRPKKGTQKQTVDAIQLFAPTEAEVRPGRKAITQEVFAERRLEGVIEGHTVGAAEKRAAAELLRGDG